MRCLGRRGEEFQPVVECHLELDVGPWVSGEVGIEEWQDLAQSGWRIMGEVSLEGSEEGLRENTLRIDVI